MITRFFCLSVIEVEKENRKRKRHQHSMILPLHLQDPDYGLFWKCTKAWQDERVFSKSPIPLCKAIVKKIMQHFWSPTRGAKIQPQVGLRAELRTSTQIQVGILQFIFLLCSRTRGKAFYVQIYD